MRRNIQFSFTSLALLATSALAQPAAPTTPATPATPAGPAAEAHIFAFASNSYLGLGVKEIDANRAKELKLKEEHGVEVSYVDEDAPAGKAGVKVSDVVLEYNGQRVEGKEQFIRIVGETPVGRQVKLSIIRQGAPMTLTATIARRSNSMVTARSARKIADDVRLEAEKLRSRIQEEWGANMPRPYMGWSNGRLGVEAESLSDQLATYFGVKEGVLVRSVLKGSAAETAGIKAGDVIVKFDNSKVATPREIATQLRAARQKKSIPLQLMRERKEMSLEVNLPEENSRLTVPKARIIRNTTPTNKDQPID